MLSKAIFCTAILALIHSGLAASAADWRGRSIYQVVTDRFARADGSTTATCNTADRIYCGGSWEGLIKKLDYIQGMGFDAVWISPVTKQVQETTPYGDAYHGYWQQDINSLNSHFGTEQDLQNLAAELHSRGMYLMVDVVVNHYGWNGPSSSIDYTQFVPFSSPTQYHSYCAIDYSKTGNLTQIEDCWMGDETVSLPDLKTEDPVVAKTWNDWIVDMVRNYSIDGLRLDSAMEVNPSFWNDFSSSAGVYIVGEVYHSDYGLVCGYQNHLEGLMNYPTYYPLIKAFESTSGSISGLSDMINNVKSTCRDVTALGSFSENHDQPRFASLTEDMALSRNVITFTVLADGIPIIYNGQEQHYNALGGYGDPYNREAIWLSGYNTSAPLYVLIAALNKAHKNAIADDSTYLDYNNYPIYIDTTTIAMRKGKMVTVLSNKGTSGASYTLTLASGYAANTTVTELLTCHQLTADSSGNLAVPMANGEPRVYYPTANIGGQCAS